MNILKKSLAMFLVLCLMFSAVPVTAFADEPNGTNPTVTETTEETTVPVTSVPETSVPETSVPETTVPETTVPETTVPETTVPETTVPETTVPETTVPETTVPETTVPETTVPETTVPETTVPETTVPETTVPETTVPETTVPETTVPETTVPETTVPETTVSQTTTPQVNTPLTSPNPYGVSTTDLDADIATAALTMGTKPDGGTTEKEPFPQGTGGSNSFRIPALVTLNNGNLLAAADARWNTTYDGGGLDTIVSISSDGGDIWNYSFANYLGDNGNVNNGTSSTAFIDPALAVIGNTVYMLVDIYPYGVALNGGPSSYPTTDVGFNANGKLLLSGNNHSSYDYYLDGNTIYDSNGNAVSGYTVDEYFNITSADGSTSSNLFFSDSPYKVARTGFLYLTKSTDGGKTWSAPTLLNLKNSDPAERVCLVGPGRGLVTSTGMIVFPCYRYYADDVSTGAGLVQNTGFIYSNDGGTTWNRSANFTGASWSSESAVVELTGGTLRFFYRNGTTNLCYVDYNNGWGTPVVMDGTNGTECIDTNSNCQLSAITHTKTVNGKQLILVSCPTGPSETGSDQSGASYRKNGKIFAFTVESDGSLKKVGSVNVTSNDAQFMYSCLTELNDGTVGILYEDKENAWGTGDSCYYTMSYAEYDLTEDMGLTFDGTATDTITVADEGITVESVTEVSEIAGLTDFVAYNVTLTKDGANYKEAATITIPLNGKFDADVTLWGFVLETDGTIKYVEDAVRDYEKDTLTFLAPHFSTVGGTPAQTDAGDGTVEDTITFNGASGPAYVLDTDGTLDDGAQYLIVHKLSDTSGVAMTYSNYSFTSTEVTINDNGTVTPSGDVTNALWTRTGTALYHAASGGYLCPGYMSQTWGDAYYVGVTHQGNGGYTLTGSWYNVYYSNGWVGYSSNTTTLYLYKYSASTVAYTVTPALQESRIASLTVSNDNYTTDTWNAYQAALTAAQNKLSAVESASYTSETAANTALNELIAAVTALENAKNALVKARNINVIYQFNGTTVAVDHMAVAPDAESITLPSVVQGTTGTVYKVEDTTLDLQADTINYTVAVTQLEAATATVAENASATLTLDYTLTEGQYVVWTSANSNYVSVAGNYAADGSYTNSATIIGNKVTEEGGEVLVTGTVYNADGTVAYATPWEVTVTEGTGSTNTTSRYVYINITRIQNTTVYYSINGGELIEITDDMLEGPYTDDNGTYYKLKAPLMDEQYTGGLQISFFAAPDEGYALTAMSSTNSAKEYYCLSNGNPDGVGSDAWPFVDGYDYDNYQYDPSNNNGNNASIFDISVGIRWGLSEGNFTVAQLKVMYANAISKGCDGIFVFTRNGQGDFVNDNSSSDKDLFTSIEFVAQKLPEMVKDIVSVTHSDNTTEAYTEGMNIGIGDTLNYEIYVYSPETTEDYGHMTYTDLVVEDELTNETWATASGVTIPSYGVTGTTIADAFEKVDSFTYVDPSGKEVTYNGTTAKFTYETSITLSAANFLSVVKNGKITNSADMTYKYQSEYSIGASETTSNAVAEVLVVVPEYVIDFGLPVEIDLTNDPLVDGDKITKAEAKYGTVQITADRKLVYTPTKILQDTEFIALTFEENETKAIIGYGVRIYPATTVHYEESFITWGSNWSGGNAAITVGPQASEELGENISTHNNYGYDPAYAGKIGASNGTNATSTAIGAKGSFTFTGNGIQVFANATEDSGYVSVEVKNSSGQIVKVAMVNTIVGKGTTAATAGQTGDHNGLPIVSLVDLQNMLHDTYTVTLTKVVNTKEVHIDGIRVFNTVEDSSIFAADLEDEPKFYELRDYVLNAINISDSTSKDYGNLNALATQVYNGISSDGEAPEAVITENKGADDIYGEGATAQDLLDNGPKNELYLYKGQTLTFKVTSKRIMQIGLKAPRTATEAEITVVDSNAPKTQTVSVNSSVDMFYDLVGAAQAATEYTVNITNKGEDILSVTLLKVCDDPSFAFKALSAEDIKDVLMNVYNLKDAEIPTEPEVTEPEVPAETTKPTEPEVPAETTKPTEPEVPAETTKPTEPEVPAETTKPTEPEVPAETTKPTEPEVPAETTKPTEPEVPAETTKPTEPEVPAETTKPAEPEVPAETTKPNKPGKPSKPGKPTESTEPEETKPVETQPEVTEPETPTEPQISAEPEAPAVEYADAVLTVKLVDYKGKELGSVKLTSYGIEGKTAVFTAEEIVQAAKTQLPKKYALVDESAVDDVQVRYGAYGKVKVQIGKVATLNITFINLLGKKQGTATVTGVQTAGGYRVVSAYQIRSLAPEGRFAVWFLPTFISYGSTSRLIIPVF